MGDWCGPDRRRTSTVLACLRGDARPAGLIGHKAREEGSSNHGMLTIILYRY